MLQSIFPALLVQLTTQQDQQHHLHALPVLLIIIVPIEECNQMLQLFAELDSNVLVEPCHRNQPLLKVEPYVMSVNSAPVKFWEPRIAQSELISQILVQLVVSTVLRDNCAHQQQ